MKQHLSVLMLAARSTIYRVLALLVVMTVTQGTLFYLALQRTLGSEPLGLEHLINDSRIGLVSAAGFLLLTALLSLTGCEIGGSKLRYTLQRLSLRERTTAFWWAAYNAVCFFLFWAAQLIIALLLSRFYVAQMDAAYVSSQTVFLAFYRNNFLHSLLPLAATSRYVRNIVFALALGSCAACFSFRQRRGKLGVAVVALAIIVTLNFAKPMGSLTSDLLLAMLALSIATGAVIGTWGDGADANES